MTDDELMDLALAEARAAREHGDDPVGAVVMLDGELLASRHNERELTGDPTAVAVILALRDAAARLGEWRLTGATLVATLEPCVMGAGAASQARLSRVVFGVADPQAGACASLYNVGADARLNHEFDVDWRVREAECAELLTEYFSEKR